jgi:putative peptidoglycan lipid II flippase
VLGESIVGALFEWGRFTAFDTRQTAAALTGYSVGLAGYSVSKVLSPALYALDDARTPMLVSIVSVAVNYFTASMLAKTLGHVGLALSTSLVAVAGALALYLFLGAPQFPCLARGALKITMASALMGGACLLSTHAVHAFSSGKAAQFADIAVSVPFGAAIFYGAARALRIHELEALKKGMLHCD